MPCGQSIRNPLAVDAPYIAITAMDTAADTKNTQKIYAVHMVIRETSLLPVAHLLMRENIGIYIDNTDK